jgi:Mg2+-importing ATPase
VKPPPAAASGAAGGADGLDLVTAAASDASDVLARLGSSPAGLDPGLAASRLELYGPNAVQSHGASPVAVLLRQLRNPLLLLLAAAALTSLYVGEHSDALIILAISSLSVGLGFFNEYRSERAVEALHSRIRHKTVVVRGGSLTSIDVIDLVPGDIVLLDVGDVVPADVRLLTANALECDEAVLTGESAPVEKTADKVGGGGDVRSPASCVQMGTVVRNGTARGIVIRTGMATEFGRIARQLGGRPAETAFQIGLRDFSGLLVWVTAILTISIFAINWALGRPILEAALFSLAVAVGLTPQLLPAIVTISLSVGSRRLAEHGVLVKTLVSIEDLGNVQVLFTDKTGTLTEGQLSFMDAVPAAGAEADVLALGLLCNSAAVEAGAVVGGNPLDRALWEAPGAAAAKTAAYRRLAEAPFDYVRKLMSVLVEDPSGRRLMITKGAPEAVLERCAGVGEADRARADSLFESGARVVAVATREASGQQSVGPADEHDLRLQGFLVFRDALKHDAASAVDRLTRLQVQTKIVTGDNERVASRVCADLGLKVDGTLSGAQLDRMSDDELGRALATTSIFARVTPEHKSRIIKVQRSLGTVVAFMGDGVNDAVALHDADVGISVDSATDVAKDAADVVLLEKDLGTLSDGVVEGRRIFANTIKYVLMGTSSNFGNMFSAAGASVFLPFLPMTPTQILLNNLLYDISEMTIPTDHVDEELLARPAHWDVGFIRRFMIIFGPISSAFDFLTFGVMLWFFHARDSVFQSGWFVESLATQTLVIFVIRTRRLPFWTSRPSVPLAATSLACVVVGAVVPFTPVARIFGFTPLPPAFFGILGLMVLAYLGLVELAKRYFYRNLPAGRSLTVRLTRELVRARRVAFRFSAGFRRPVRPPLPAAVSAPPRDRSR